MGDHLLSEAPPSGRGATSDAALRPPARDEISYFDLLTPLLAHWATVATCVAIGATGSVALALLERPTFTAEATFTTPSTGGGVSLPSGIAGLAGQFGISLDRGGSIASPAFFVDLAGAQGILQQLLLSSFPNPDSIGNPRPVPLLDQLQIKGDRQELRMARGLRVLRRKIAATAGRTGIVTIDVKDGSPVRAAWIANRLVDLLNEFNLGRLQFQSRQQRIFAEQRLAQAKQELNDAEQAQLSWAERNRVYQSPILQYQKARLEREVALKNEVMLTLTRAYEEARIAEARDVPTITILDRALPPAERSAPKRKMMVVVGTGLAALVGVMVALLRAHFETLAAAGRSDYDAFATALRRMRSELVTIIRPRRR